MKKNVGSLDRVIRVLIGVAVCVWGLSTNNWLGAIGLLPLLTGLAGWCPAYCPFKISTACKGSSCGSCKNGGCSSEG
jgi:hypothetical protein